MSLLAVDIGNTTISLGAFKGKKLVSNFKLTTGKRNAYKKPIFVVDTYTRRFCSAHDLPVSGDYDDYREYFESNLRNDHRIFNEFHALIVKWGQENKLKE